MTRRRIGTSALLIMGFTAVFCLIGFLTRSVYILTAHRPFYDIFARVQAEEPGTIFGYPYVADIHEELIQLGYPENRVIAYCGCGIALGDSGEVDFTGKPGVRYLHNITVEDGESFHFEVLLPWYALPGSEFWIIGCGAAGMLIGTVIVWRRVVVPCRKIEEETV